MKTLLKKIAEIEAEIERVVNTIIPDLRTKIGLSIEAYESAENEEAQARALGEMETLCERVSVEHKAMVRLKQRLRRLKLNPASRGRVRRPCGKC